MAAVIRMRCASARTHSGGDSVEDKFILIESCGAARRQHNKSESKTTTKSSKQQAERQISLGAHAALAWAHRHVGCASARREDGL